MSQLPSLSQLRDPDAFLRRHLGPDAAEQQAMLDSLGLGSRVELIEQTVPPGIRLNRALDLPPALDEQAALAKLRGYAEQNQVWTSLIGMGYHGTLTPTVILRNVLENPGWYTAYTPYQPEIAQGRLEALLNFQQLTIDLTGLELANASLLDEATAAAEAMALAKRVAKSKSNVFFVDEKTVTRKPFPWCRPVPRALASSWSSTLWITCRSTRCSARCCSIPTPMARSAICAR
jgi:glycine dehydrogenase